MYHPHPYRTSDGHDYPGASREAAIADASILVGSSGGILLDDSRAILAISGELEEDEVIRVSGDQITREQARELLARTALWWDETTDTVRVVDRDALIAATAARP